MEDTYEVLFEGSTENFDSKSEAEDAIKQAVEDGTDENDIEVYKVTREQVDFDVEKEVTVTIN